MAKVTTKNLTGAALDWAVAECAYRDGRAVTVSLGCINVATAPGSGVSFRFMPSTDWQHGGEIIEREGISNVRADDDYGRDEQGFCNDVRVPVWCAEQGQQSYSSSTNHEHHDAMYQLFVDSMVYGPTPLVAAMRCFVSSKMGDTIEVPDQLQH